MSTMAMRALTQISEALTAFRRHRAQQQAAEVAARRPDCEFEHPHPSHPCGRRIPKEAS